jgi:hypothetical protein
MESKTRKYFLILIAVLYILAFSLTYIRVYVLHAYPVYYSEEEMPDMISQFRTVNFWYGHGV